MDAREKILETATRLFSVHGYANTSLSQVAKDAQVSKALIFWHFENKQNLFRTALQRTLEPYFINVVDYLEGLSEIDQIKRLVDEYYKFVSRNMYSVKFFLSLILRDEKHPDDLVGHMTELNRVFGNLLADILDSGRQSGLFRANINPPLDAGLIMSALHGLLVQGFMREARENAEQILEHLKTSLIDGLRADGAPDAPEAAEVPALRDAARPSPSES